MFCTHCGKEVPNEAKFCRYCGSPLVKVNPPVVNELSVSEEETPVAESIEQIIFNEEDIASAEQDEEPYSCCEENTVLIEDTEKPCSFCDETSAEIEEQKPSESVFVPAEPIQYSPVENIPKKKIYPLAWVCIAVAGLLVASIVIIIMLLSKLATSGENDTPSGFDNPSSSIGDEGEISTESEIPAYDFDDYPELYSDFDEFIEGKNFNKDFVLESGEILYMGEAYFDNVGGCYVCFTVSADRQKIKNFSVYLSDINLELSSNGTKYDLSGISIRNDYNNVIDFQEYTDTILLGTSTLTDFYMDYSLDYAFGILDFTFTYYASSSVGGVNPIDTYLGISDVGFVPVRIG